MTTSDDIELVDFGDAARLERFGDRLVDRPHPGAFGARRRPDAWGEADLRFDRDRGWSGPSSAAGPWRVSAGDLTMELRPTAAGQVGLFPEHLAMLDRLAGRVRASASHGNERPNALHLFGYTGLATLAMAAAGASVTHVDASRPTVGWARRNAEASGLADRPIRWIVDDARTFVEREGRRKRRYDLLVLDPPSYGHGTGGRPWQLETDLEPMLAACRAILVADAAILLTAHTPRYGPDVLGATLARTIERPIHAIETGLLAIGTADGRTMDLGAFARFDGLA